MLDAIPDETSKKCFAQASQLALATGLVCIQEQEPLAGTLSYNLLSNNVPALTLELGEPYVINEYNVQSGVDAIWNVLVSMRVCAPLQQPSTESINTLSAARVLAYYDRPHSSTSGVIRFLAQPGNSIHAGQAFAKVVNAFGKHQETVVALRDGIILGHTDSSVVFPGMPIMAFGVDPQTT